MTANFLTEPKWRELRDIWKESTLDSSQWVVKTDISKILWGSEFKYDYFLRKLSQESRYNDLIHLIILNDIKAFQEELEKIWWEQTDAKLFCEIIMKLQKIKKED